MCDCLSFFFTRTATTAIYTLSLHDALPISVSALALVWMNHPDALVELGDLLADRELPARMGAAKALARSEEHTSELQSRVDLVCRLLLEKKKKKNSTATY